MTLPSPALAAHHAVAARLPLADKVELLTGGSAWKLRPNAQVGLREVVMSDGPAGVRGTGEVPGETSVLFPAPSALAATWDTGLADEVGAAFAQEARGHGVDVVLAPQVNLQRTPVGGRHFECYSEDPLLTSRIGTSLWSACSARGVGRASSISSPTNPRPTAPPTSPASTSAPCARSTWRRSSTPCGTRVSGRSWPPTTRSTTGRQTAP